MQLNDLTLKQREKLFRELRISITHHSNTIEGTTLSYGETKEFEKEFFNKSREKINEQ